MTLVMMMTILHLHEHAFVDDDDDDDHHQREHSGLAPLLLAVARPCRSKGRPKPGTFRRIAAEILHSFGMGNVGTLLS